MRFAAVFLICFSVLPVLAQVKINGVHLESPQKRIYSDYVGPVQRISANWIAIVPFAFMDGVGPNIEYNCDKNWWGSTPQGIANTVKYCKFHEIKTFLKPHFWVDGYGWAGELSFSEKDWKKWEANYERFIIGMAKTADSLDIDMLCIGVELKTAVKKRTAFWNQLIPKIRKAYKGKITYASNWDNYKTVPFWNQLDLIGVDAYFPLSDKSLPSEKELIENWQSHQSELASFSKSIGKKILFTEMGYRSISGGAGAQWTLENEADTESVNLVVQTRAYESLFKTFWKQSWFAGGFLWEWHPYDKQAGGLNHSNYTPQNKPTEKIIQKWFESFN